MGKVMAKSATTRQSGAFMHLDCRVAALLAMTGGATNQYVAPVMEGRILSKYLAGCTIIISISI
jgi:hypothetical protein